MIPRRLDHIAVERGLGVQTRQRLGDHELKLGAKETDALRARLLQMMDIERQARIEHQRHPLAVLGDSRLVAQPRELGGAFGAERDALLIG